MAEDDKEDNKDEEEKKPKASKKKLIFFIILALFLIFLSVGGTLVAVTFMAPDSVPEADELRIKTKDIGYNT